MNGGGSAKAKSSLPASGHTRFSYPQAKFTSLKRIALVDAKPNVRKRRYTQRNASLVEPEDGGDKPPSSRRSLPRLNLYEFCEYSTLHGIYDIYRARHVCIRCFWVLIFISALLMAVYGCYAILAEFLLRPVVVSYFVTRNDTLILPDIVMCPINRFNRTYLEMHNISENLGQYLELSFWGFGVKNFHAPTLLWEQYIRYNISAELDSELDELLVKHNYTFDQFFDNSGLDCSSMITFPKQGGSKTYDCHQFETLMTSAGKCWRIPGILQQASGYGYGLTMMITIPSNEFHPGMNNLPSAGIVIKLVEKGKGIDYDLSFVPVGVHAIMPLKATSYEFINDPPRYECIPHWTVPESYSRVACWDDCVISVAEDLCNCSPPATSKPRRPICTPRKFFKCLVQQFSRIYTKQVKKCNLKCKPSCSYWQYQTTMTYTSFPSPEARHFIKNETEYEFMRTHQILFEVFYENLEYTLIKHIPAMTIDSFIAQLGGQVSLWVGGSILTVVQLFIFFMQVLYNRCVEVPAAAIRNRREFLAKTSTNIVSHTAFMGLGFRKDDTSLVAKSDQPCSPTPNGSLKSPLSSPLALSSLKQKLGSTRSNINEHNNNSKSINDSAVSGGGQTLDNGHKASVSQSSSDLKDTLLSPSEELLFVDHHDTLRQQQEALL